MEDGGALLLGGGAEGVEGGTALLWGGGREGGVECGPMGGGQTAT